MGPAEIGQMRDALLSELYEKRKQFTPHMTESETPLPDYIEETEPPLLTVSVSKIS